MVPSLASLIELPPGDYSPEALLNGDLPGCAVLNCRPQISPTAVLGHCRTLILSSFASILPSSFGQWSLDIGGIAANPGRTLVGPAIALFYENRLGTFPFIDPQTGAPINGGIPQVIHQWIAVNK